VMVALPAVDVSLKIVSLPSLKPRLALLWMEALAAVDVPLKVVWPPAPCDALAPLLLMAAWSPVDAPLKIVRPMSPFRPNSTLAFTMEAPAALEVSLKIVWPPTPNPRSWLTMRIGALAAVDV